MGGGFDLIFVVLEVGFGLLWVRRESLLHFGEFRTWANEFWFDLIDVAHMQSCALLGVVPSYPHIAPPRVRPLPISLSLLSSPSLSSREIAR